MKKFLKELVKKIYIPIEKQILYSQNKNIIKDKRVVFLPPPGIGDILLVCEYVDSYSNVYNKIPVIAVTKKMHLQIGELFDKDIEMILLEVRATDTLLQSGWLEKLGGKIYDRGHPSENFRQAITYSMGLEENCDFIKPEKFVSEDIEKRVVIFTDARTCNILIGDEKWRSIAKKLSVRGYGVYFNSYEEKRWDGFNTIWYKLEETMKFVSRSAAVIGYRSGILDLICECTERPMLVFYPNDRKKGDFPSCRDFDCSPNEKNMEYLSLSVNFKLTGERMINEYIYNSEDFEDCVYSFCEEVL